MLCTCVFMCSYFRVINILVTASLNYLENVDAPACIRLLITIVLSFSVVLSAYEKSVFLFPSSVGRNMGSTACW